VRPKMSSECQVVKFLPATLELWFRNIFYWIFSVQFFENEATVKDAL
jgi:hypothetical protein